MNELVIQSETFANTGNIAAEGFRKLLGRPTLGLLQTTLREALQNSIDAAKIGDPPHVLLRSRVLDPVQLEMLRHRIFGALPMSDTAVEPLRTMLSADSVRVLEICDSGTVGLGGPTSADEAPEEGEALDFVNFLRNVGSAHNTSQGGGTYGYGKTSLYALSGCSTIIVDTQTVFRGTPTRRFMACHLGRAYDAQVPGNGARRFTGRHWWGSTGREGVVDPVIGEEAASLARSLGMPERGAGTTGTSILILSPQLEQNSPQEVGQAILETVLWFFWPRMVRSAEKERRLTVKIVIDGNEVSVPPPEDYPPLDLFAAALRQHHEQSERLEEIVSHKPKKLLGHLSITHGLCTPRRFDPSRDGVQIPARSSHIALMRPVELVVRYIRGVPFDDERVEWAGVFICSRNEEVEAAFAEAEPPAHDDWVPDNLPASHGKTYVRVALARLNEQAGSYATPQANGIGTTETKGPSIAAVSARMGRLLEHTSDRSASRTARPCGGHSGKQKPTVSRPVFVRLELDENQQTNAIFEASLQNDGRQAGLLLSAEAFLVAEGNLVDMSDLPPHQLPRIRSLSLNGQRIDGSAIILGSEGGTIQIQVQIPGQSAVGTQLYLRDGAAT